MVVITKEEVGGKVRRTKSSLYAYGMVGGKQVANKTIVNVIDKKEEFSFRHYIILLLEILCSHSMRNGISISLFSSDATWSR